jgi:hypothetical protein
MKAYGEWMYRSTFSWPRHAPTASPPWKSPGTHWIGGWVDPRAGLDDMEKRNLLTLPGLEVSSVPCLNNLLLVSDLCWMNESRTISVPSPYLSLGPSCGRFPSDFLTKLIYSYIPSPLRDTRISSTLFSSVIIFHRGRNPWTSDKLVARPLRKQRTTQTQNKSIQTSKVHAVSRTPTQIPAI